MGYVKCWNVAKISNKKKTKSHPICPSLMSPAFQCQSLTYIFANCCDTMSMILQRRQKKKPPSPLKKTPRLRIQSIHFQPSSLASCRSFLLYRPTERLQLVSCFRWIHAGNAELANLRAATQALQSDTNLPVFRFVNDKEISFAILVSNGRA